MILYCLQKMSFRYVVLFRCLETPFSFMIKTPKSNVILKSIGKLQVNFLIIKYLRGKLLSFFNNSKKILLLMYYEEISSIIIYSCCLFRTRY